MTHDSFNDITLVTDSPHEMYIGWTVAGDIFPTVIAGVLGSDWVFEGDQTLNFTASSSYPISAPDLTPPSTTGGEWTETPAYDDGTGLTTFTDTKASFGAFMHGWVLMPNVEQPSYLTIFGVPPGGQTLVVQGDASYSSIATSGATYRVIAPAGIQRNTGALANIGSEGEVTWNPQNRGPSNLWAGYRHVPAMAGWYDEGETTTTGAQSGWNLSGTYHCWNRTYDVFKGRWTTPGPAATPWGNLWSYVNGAPLGAIDASGLEPSITSVNYDNTVSLILEMLRSGMFEKAAAAGLGSALAAKALDEAVTRYLREKGGGGTAVAEPPPAPAPIAKPVPRPTPVPTPKPEAGPRPAPAPKPDPLPAPLPDSSGEGGCPPPVPPPGGPGDPPSDADRCKQIHDHYKILGCKGCDKATTKAECFANASCLATESALRFLYLELKCDFILEGSIKKGSEKARDGHLEQAIGKFKALGKCLAKASELP